MLNLIKKIGSLSEDCPFCSKCIFTLFSYSECLSENDIATTEN